MKRYQPLIELLILVGIVIMIVVIVVVPALRYQPIKYRNIEVVDDDFFPEPLYFQLKRELKDWSAILLAFAGFIYGRIKR